MKLDLRWNLIIEKDVIWVKALEAKYCRNSNYLSASSNGGASWIWRRLLQVRDISQLGCVGRSGLEKISIFCVIPKSLDPSILFQASSLQTLSAEILMW